MGSVIDRYRGSQDMGWVGNLRRVANPPAEAAKRARPMQGRRKHLGNRTGVKWNLRQGRLPIGRRIPSCPTSSTEFLDLRRSETPSMPDALKSTPQERRNE